MLRTLPSSDAVASVAASVPASAAGAASVAGVDAVLSVVVVSAVSDDPHPAPRCYFCKNFPTDCPGTKLPSITTLSTRVVRGFSIVPINRLAASLPISSVF